MVTKSCNYGCERRQRDRDRETKRKERESTEEAWIIEIRKKYDH